MNVLIYHRMQVRNNVVLLTKYENVLLIAAQQRLLSAQQVRGLQEGRQSGGCAHSHR